MSSDYFPKDKHLKPTNSNTNTPAFPVVDPSWELTDPTPDIYALFISFNKDFFQSKLGSVEVKWSKRMTSCAGICSFSPRGRACVITLSEPLLKLRPRKDLVETLLHEMIHAYLFLSSGTTDREAHGPNFLEYMHRINRLTGANISVYHSFHEEVRYFQTHWWRCDGPCRTRPPYMGFVKRSTNRAPGPNDFWWKTHQATCGGTYIKVKEPPKKEKKPKAPAKPSIAEGMSKLFGGSTSSTNGAAKGVKRKAPDTGTAIAATTGTAISGTATGTSPKPKPKFRVEIPPDWENFPGLKDYFSQPVQNYPNPSSSAGATATGASATTNSNNDDDRWYWQDYTELIADEPSTVKTGSSSNSNSNPEDTNPEKVVEEIVKLFGGAKSVKISLKTPAPVSVIDALPQSTASQDAWEFWPFDADGEDESLAAIPMPTSTSTSAAATTGSSNNNGKKWWEDPRLYEEYQPNNSNGNNSDDDIEILDEF